MSDVLVVIGPATSPLRKADRAAVGFGRAAAGALGGHCDVLLVGAGSAAAAEESAALGARRVHTASGAGLETYTAEGFAALVAAFLDARDYRLIAAATASGSREYLPRLAALIDAPMASDVLAIESLDDERAVFTRAVFVGNLLASVELSGPRVLATCRASAFDTPETSSSKSAIEAFAPPPGATAHDGKRFVALHQAKSERPDLKEASIVVSVGRGTRGPADGIPLCERLADAFGAALGATRAVVDAGWLPNEYQVGQTGKIVAPELYVAIGLSGSIQHIAGMRNSKTIVAINKDPEAPIFEIADVGLVADLFDAVPALTAAVESRRG